MHENITKRIIEYLLLDTSYAIILNGKYGIGKTHYIKTELFPKIKELEGKDDSTKYTPVLVSLFGTKTIEDIQDRIFLALYPKLDMKGLRIFASLLNAGIKFLNNDGKKILKEAGVTSGSMTDYSKILICIDDIDRKSTALDLAEVLGFVNNLVENFNAKVLLITNEDKLRNERETKEAKADDYSLLKEKVIGVTMNFSSDTSKIIDEIIKSKYKNNEKSYFDFLTKYKDVINQRISQNDDNLRNLLFFLEHFKIIFKVSEETLSEDEKYAEIKDKVLEDILKQALPVSIEYKMGKLHNGNFEGVKKLYSNTNNLINEISFDFDEEEVENTEPIDPYFEDYKEKYLAERNDNTQIKCYESIFDYIIGKFAFDKKKFEEELSLQYKFKENKIPRREEVLNMLSSWQYLDFPPEDYKGLINEMVSYVDKGEYALDQYVNIFSLVMRHDILECDIDVLKERFKEGINNGKANHKYIINFDYPIFKGGYGDGQLKKIQNYCIEVNEEMKEKEEKEEIASFFQCFNDNPLSYVRNFDNESSAYKLLYVLARFDFEAFWKVIEEMKNTDIMHFGFYVKSKCSANTFTAKSSEEIFLQKFKINVREKIDKTTTSKLTKFVYQILAKDIDELLEKKN